MNPIKREKTVIVEFWECGDSDHCHKTSEVALKCMQKQITRKNHVTISPAEKRARWIRATRMVLDGATYKEVGEQLNRSGPRIRSYVSKVVRNILFGLKLETYPDHDYYNIRQVREHKGFYLKHMVTLEKKWELSVTPPPASNLSRRVTNALVECFNCQEGELTPEIVARIPLQVLKRHPWIGKAAAREIELWMRDAGYEHNFAGWEKPNEEETKVTDCQVPLPSLQKNGREAGRASRQDAEVLLRQIRQERDNEAGTVDLSRLLTIQQVLEYIPMSKSAWWAGIRSGIYPKGFTLGVKRVWRASEIAELIDRLASLPASQRGIELTRARQQRVGAILEKPRNLK